MVVGGAIWQEPIVSGVVADDGKSVLASSDEHQGQQIEQRMKPQLAQHDSGDHAQPFDPDGTQGACRIDG